MRPSCIVGCRSGRVTTSRPDRDDDEPDAQPLVRACPPSSGSYPTPPTSCGTRRRHRLARLHAAFAAVTPTTPTATSGRQGEGPRPVPHRRRRRSPRRLDDALAWCAATEAGPSCGPSPKRCGGGGHRSSLTTPPAPPTVPSRQRTWPSSRSSGQTEGSETCTTTGSAPRRSKRAMPDSTRHEHPAPPSQVGRVEPHKCGCTTSSNATSTNIGL